VSARQPGSDSPDVITLGESMVLLVPEPGQALAEAATLDVHCAGAESNVALYLADLGRSVAWVSRLGADPWGDRISRDLSTSGVSTSYVIRDPKAPTGVFFKDAVGGTTRVHYYRRGSAASRLSPEDLDRVPVEDARVVHTSGITAAISATAAATAERLLERGRVVGHDGCGSCPVSARQPTRSRGQGR
jgi:2-dehydro-3-deoxygluconokinase